MLLWQTCNFHTCWHAKKDSMRFCGHLNKKAIKAVIIRDASNTEGLKEWAMKSNNTL